MITEKELIDATLTAINNCQKTYLNWSYNEWLSFAPEYFLTVKIAEEISKINKRAACKFHHHKLVNL
jgi:hypothetical protein